MPSGTGRGRRVLRQLGANVRAHLLFYRRNRLLVLIAILLAFVFLMTLVPSLLFRSSSQRFEIVKTIFETLNFFLFLFAAALGLLGVWSHLRDRSIKMVMTKPVPPELWLLSHFAAAGAVMIVLVAGNVLLTTGLFLLWDVPVQDGIVFLGLSSICRCLILFAYLTFLSVLMHPAVAGVVVLLLQQETFYQLALLTSSAREFVEAGVYRALLGAIRHGLVFVYKVLPVYEPYPETVHRIGSSFRLADGDLSTLGLTLLYTLAIAGLFYLLAVAALRRRRFI